MNAKYFDISQVARDVAFLIHKNEGMSKKDIEDKFGKRYARRGLNELNSQDPKLVVYDRERCIYKVSKDLGTEIQTWKNCVRTLF